MLPATKAIPKEMLPLVDKPLIQYVVNECIAAGITEIVLVTHSSKTLSKTISIQALNLKPCWKSVLSVSEEVQSICPPHVTIMQVRQGWLKVWATLLCAHTRCG
jgi:UTP--glucose-1-phosphate uridylyltransferase